MVGGEASAADESYMRVALDEARAAAAAGEIPVGAIVVANDAVLARAHNLREERQSALSCQARFKSRTFCVNLTRWSAEKHRPRMNLTCGWLSTRREPPACKIH